MCTNNVNILITHRSRGLRCTRNCSHRRRRDRGRHRSRMRSRNYNRSRLRNLNIRMCCIIRVAHNLIDNPRTRRRASTRVVSRVVIRRALRTVCWIE